MYKKQKQFSLIIMIFWGFFNAVQSYSQVKHNKSGNDVSHDKSVLRQNESLEITAARNVLNRVLGKRSKSIQMGMIPTKEGCDSYEYSSKNGKLEVKGSSVVALTRAVYDYLKEKGYGMVGWSGSEFRLPKQWPDVKMTRVTSPFRIRQANNVVTAGYTNPYWTWERWEQELDWQAMHGFNMLLAPAATEGIASRVWKELGLSQQEIDEFYVGPAHLPWQRMGNICQVGGTLPPEWHSDQIALQHKLLKRMRELGIEPIVQSFAGFVPKGIKRIFPDLVLHNTLWVSGFPPSQRPVMLMPGDPLFAKITKMYMNEWQKEFGKAKHYLVDSFNEMELPETEVPVTELLAEYGKKTYDAIFKGDPEATWVIQGWMFGYQKHIWSPERIKALFSKVPDNKVLILDYANDYANSWEPVDGFNGKQWAYGFVPNMGAKTAYTGDMSLYATGAAKTLASPKKNNLVGFSISGEGLENNEVLYELMTDAAWTHNPINLDTWLKQFSTNRYGSCPAEMAASWDLLRKSCYSKLMDHPQFGWQTAKLGFGSVNRDPKFHEATQLFLSCSSELKGSANFRDDAIERTALSLGLKADEWFKAASDAYSIGDILLGEQAGKRGLELLTEIDQLMESHRLNRLDRWIELTKKHGSDPVLQKFYESNARRIVTIWGPPINDYSCRVWSGLVRDFYRERMSKILESLQTGKSFDKAKWELQWVESSGVSKIKPFSDPVKEAKIFFNKAMLEKIPTVDVEKGESIGYWSSANVSEEWKELEWSITVEQLKALKGVLFVFSGGESSLDIKEVLVVCDGKIIVSEKREGMVDNLNKQARYTFAIPTNVQGNNGCVIKAVVRSHGGIDSKGRVELLMP
jgi:alpha-N-acetylglucosaminidase